MRAQGRAAMTRARASSLARLTSRLRRSCEGASAAKRSGRSYTRWLGRSSSRPCRTSGARRTSSYRQSARQSSTRSAQNAPRKMPSAPASTRCRSQSAIPT
eukprot:4090539-Pleurochrysis_carterae.AAC.6